MKKDNKIAIIADIHGNSAALKAVLEDIEKDEQIEQIFCLGDLIGIGHETNKVLELLFSREDISFVMGNHDEEVLKIIDGKEPDSVGGEREHHEWIASRLEEKYISKLRSIAKKRTEKVNGIDFLFLHYHLNKKGEFLQIDNQPTTKRLEEIYDGTNYDVVCFGHHHTIHHFKSKNRLYVNPNSLGCTPKPFAPYSKLQIGKSSHINVSFIEVPYDNKEFLLSYEKLDVPDKDIILKVFHGEQHLNYM